MVKDVTKEILRQNLIDKQDKVGWGWGATLSCFK